MDFIFFSMGVQTPFQIGGKVASSHVRTVKWTKTDRDVWWWWWWWTTSWNADDWEMNLGSQRIPEVARLLISATQVQGAVLSVAKSTAIHAGCPNPGWQGGVGFSSVQGQATKGTWSKTGVIVAEEISHQKWRMSCSCKAGAKWILQKNSQREGGEEQLKRARFAGKCNQCLQLGYLWFISDKQWISLCINIFTQYFHQWICT